jgi:hypothetical protein
MSAPERIARAFHDHYERLAPQFGYETRPETREFDPDSQNGRLMVATVKAVLADADLAAAAVEAARRDAWEAGLKTGALFCQDNAVQSVSPDAKPTPIGDACWKHDGMKYAAAILAIPYPGDAHD